MKTVKGIRTARTIITPLSTDESLSIFGGMSEKVRLH